MELMLHGIVRFSFRIAFPVMLSTSFGVLWRGLIMDSHEHLFFECNFTFKVLSLVHMYAEMNTVHPILDDILLWFQSLASSRSFKAMVGKLIVAASSYFIWSKRNNMLFNNTRRSPKEVRYLIIITVRLKLVSFRFKNTTRVKELLVLWKMPTSQTTDNLKEVVQKELEEFKRSGIMSDFRNEMETYRDFTTSDVPNFNGVLDPIASARWLVVVEGAFCTSNCCYKCGALNHMSKDCKKQRFYVTTVTNWGTNQINAQTRRRSKARVYMMATEEDKVVHDVVTGTILVNSIPARVLYDSSASVSFLSYKFSKNLSTLPYKLPFPLEVEIANNKVVVVSDVYRKVEIEIDDITFSIDLITMIQNLVRVINPQGHEIIIYGDKRKGDFNLCSVRKARRCLSCRCHAFMVHVIDTRFKKKGVKDVLILNEFLNVFPKYLPGIPPERQVEFRIDLVLGIKVDPAKIEAVMNWQAPNNVEPKIWLFIAMRRIPASDAFLCNMAKLLPMHQDESSVITLDDLEIDPELTSRDDNFRKEIKTTSQQDNLVGEG
nr:hypothetical protein [Tanacetum cinerariifolium]